MIILEGMDNSGKSTLGKKLGLTVIHPGAPPKTPEYEMILFDRQLKDAQRRHGIVYDRVTCISQQVYRRRLFDKWYMEPLTQLLFTPGVVLVYCRPPTELLVDTANHTKAEHDTPEMLKLVEDNAHLFVESYDKLMQNLPHLVYNYTSEQDEEKFISDLLATQNIQR